MLVLRQRAKQEIDWQAVPARRGGCQQLQRAVQKRHVAVRRDDVGAVHLHLHAVLHLKHLHAGVALDQRRQNALVVRRQMLNQHKGHAGVGGGGHAREKRLKRRQTTGRCTNAHNGKAWFVRW